METAANPLSDLANGSTTEDEWDGHIWQRCFQLDAKLLSG
jgi:hypothetical protein